MIAALPLRRGVPARRAAVRTSRPGRARVTRGPRAASRQESLTWEVRLFASASAAIAIGFVLALIYLSQATAISAGGYEVQQLRAARDEIVRQNALLEVRIARLDSPARIEADAARLGLVRVPHVLVVTAEKLAARQ